VKIKNVEKNKKTLKNVKNVTRIKNVKNVFLHLWFIFGNISPACEKEYLTATTDITVKLKLKFAIE